MTRAYHPSVLAIEKRRGAMLLGIVERETLRKMRMRLRCRAKIMQRRPQGTMRCHEQDRVLHLLREGQELFTQHMCRLMLGTHTIIIPESTQHREKLVRIVQVLTELPSTRVCLTNFQSPCPLRGT